MRWSIRDSGALIYDGIIWEQTRCFILQIFVHDYSNVNSWNNWGETYGSSVIWILRRWGKKLWLIFYSYKLYLWKTKVTPSWWRNWSIECVIEQMCQLTFCFAYFGNSLSRIAWAQVVNMARGWAEHWKATLYDDEANDHNTEWANSTQTRFTVKISTKGDDEWLANTTTTTTNPK